MADTPSNSAVEGAITSLFYGWTGNIINIVIYSVLILAAATAIIYGVYMYRQWQSYNIQVRIYSKRKNGFKTWDDWGAFRKNKKTGEVEGFRLKKMKLMIQSPPYEALMASPKGNIVHLLQLSNDEFFVLNPEIDDVEGSAALKIKLKVIESDIQLWASATSDKIRFLYQKKGFWEQYGAFVMFGVAAIMIIILIYLTLQKFEILKDVATSFKDSVAMLKDLRSSSIQVPSTAPA